jgi:hypothetical protein
MERSANAGRELDLVIRKAWGRDFHMLIVDCRLLFVGGLLRSVAALSLMRTGSDTFSAAT